MFLRQRAAANATLSCLFGCAGHRMAIAVAGVAGDEDCFIAEADKAGARIVHVIDPHVHADHSCGGLESDRLGRHLLNAWGMWICGAGVALMPLGEGPAWWSVSAAVAGLGMAMLYPNLSAAVAGIARPNRLAPAIGIYRFRRDLGYRIGALGGRLETAFGFVAVALGLSGAVLFRWGEETHPRLDPAV